MVSKFIEKWADERSGGMQKYYVRHLLGMTGILSAMIIGDYLANKEFSVLFLIAIVVSLCFPILSWFLNELRYRKYLRDQ